MSQPLDHPATREKPADPCARAFDWLIEGRAPEDNAEVDAHVASCLACFRVRTDLADLPELTARLRALEASPEAESRPRPPANAATAANAADSSWGSLPSRVANAVLAPTAGQERPSPRPAAFPLIGDGATRPAVGRHRWHQRLGLPALGGAGVVGLAAAAVLWLGRPAGSPSLVGSPPGTMVSPEQQRPLTVRTGGQATQGADDEDDDGPGSPEAETAFDEIAALDEPTLRQLAHSLARSAL